MKYVPAAASVAPAMLEPLAFKEPSSSSVSRTVVPSGASNVMTVSPDPAARPVIDVTKRRSPAAAENE
jgi:hypothetical protein